MSADDEQIFYRPGFPKWFVTNELNFDGMELVETNQASFDHLIRENPIGEARKGALRFNFDRKLT